jgi:hypothetical protein
MRYRDYTDKRAETKVALTVGPGSAIVSPGQDNPRREARGRTWNNG